MDDRDFFDTIYQLWSKTTGAQDHYYMPEQNPDHSGRWNVYAIGQDETRKLVASGLSEPDADFVTGIHGCLPDLIRSLGSAHDEADRLDEEKDTLIGRVAELEMEVDKLDADNARLSHEVVEGWHGKAGGAR